MSPIVILLLAVSLAVLLLGTYLWRITSNRSVFMHTMFGTICMMLAAYHAAAHHDLQWSITLPFLTAMLFGGRAIGTWWRSRSDDGLRLPASLMTTVAALTLMASVSVYFSL